MGAVRGPASRSPTGLGTTSSAGRCTVERASRPLGSRPLIRRVPAADQAGHPSVVVPADRPSDPRQTRGPPLRASRASGGWSPPGGPPERRAFKHAAYWLPFLVCTGIPAQAAAAILPPPIALTYTPWFWYSVAMSVVPPVAVTVRTGAVTRDSMIP